MHIGRAEPRVQFNYEYQIPLPSSRAMPEDTTDKDPDRGDYALIDLQATGTIFKDFPADMWGVFILIAVEDLGMLLSCKVRAQAVARLFFGFTGLLLNLWLQAVILWYVNKYIVGEAVYQTQTNYKEFHGEVFNVDGSFNETKWHVWDGPYMALCNLAMSKVSFTMAVVFMWIARMLGELRETERLARDVWKIKALGSKPYSEMIMDKRSEEGDQYYVVALSTSGRIFVFLLVIIPKFLITFCLTCIGCRWLCATESFSDLILNALALDFIIGVDEIVYANFAPQHLSEFLESAKMTHEQSEELTSNHESNVICAYVKSVLLMISCMAVSYLYLNNFQQVIPSFPHDIAPHCVGWFDKYYSPFCWFYTEDPMKSCFPYGGS